MKAGHQNHCRPSPKECSDRQAQLHRDPPCVEIPVAHPLSAVLLTQELDGPAEVAAWVGGLLISRLDLGIADADPGSWVVLQVPQPIGVAVGLRSAVNAARVRRGGALAGAYPDDAIGIREPQSH